MWRVIGGLGLLFVTVLLLLAWNWRRIDAAINREVIEAYQQERQAAPQR